MSPAPSPTGRSASTRAVLILLAVMAPLLAAPFLLQASGLHPPLEVRLLIAVLVVIPAFLATCNYWRNIDEAAREAQKWAWFWGGSIGMALGVLAIAIGFVRPEWFDIAAMLPEHATALSGIFYGAMAMVAAQLIGFVLAWAYWWARRR
jgi:hypothetical protein